MMQTRSFAADFRAAGDDVAPVIEGYFSVFNSNYEIGRGLSESIDEHAFDGALDDDIRALVNHNTTLVLGRTKANTLTLTVDGHGLFGRVSINPKDTDAMNCYERVRRGDVSQCSFGFDITREDTEVREDGSVHWTIMGVKLYEVSVCTFPAYEETGVTARSDEAARLRQRASEAWAARMLAKIGKGEENA